MAIQAGKYRAKACGECVLGESSKKGTPFIEFYLAITDGENKGGRVRFTGYFSENTNERTIQSLGHCGWKGDDLSEFADGALHGLDSKEVEIVVELEEYDVVKDGQPTGEKRTAPRVAFINSGGGYLNKTAAMNPQAAQSFGERMRGLVLKVKEASPVRTTTNAAQPANTTGAASAPEADPIPF